MRRLVVTGASSGIGLAIAGALAEQGHSVVMVCRDQQRGEAARDQVQAKAGPGATVELVLGDLSTIASCGLAATAIARACPRPDVLVHNAGLWPTRYQRTAEGFELAFAVNHLAPFVLTRQLLPLLHQAEDARIVQVTAGLYPTGRIDLLRTPSGADFGMMRTYANTKLWNLLATLELARREADSGLAIVAVHPGVIRTALGEQGSWLAPLMRLAKRRWDTPATGARGPLRAALDPGLRSVKGLYLNEVDPVRLDPVAQDEQLAQQVWTRTEDLVAACSPGGVDDQPRQK
jgi:NAD(P)-dependent dehydrogenase (short-subunit alcohol dehydrogenase family)